MATVELDKSVSSGESANVSQDVGQDVDQVVVIGRITAVYGVKGWVKIHSFTQPAENFINYQDYYLERAGQWQALDLEQIKRHHKGLVGHIKGIDDRDQAKAYCQRDIAVPVTELASLEEGQFYWHQLEGLTVLAMSGDGRDIVLGVVDYLIETGANDVLVVKSNNESIDGKERLIPYLEGQVVKEVDLDTGIIRVDWDPEF